MFAVSMSHSGNCNAISLGGSSDHSDYCASDRPMKLHHGDAVMGELGPERSSLAPASGLDSALGEGPSPLHHGDAMLGELGPKRNSLAPASGLDSALGVGQCDLLRVDAKGRLACGLGSIVVPPLKRCDAVVMVVPESLESQIDNRFYPYSLAKCPDQNSTPKMPENKASSVSDGHEQVARTPERDGSDP